MDTQTDVSDAAAKAASAIGQAILMKMPMMGSHSLEVREQAEPESFYGRGTRLNSLSDPSYHHHHEIDTFCRREDEDPVHPLIHAQRIVKFCAENETNAVLSTPPCSPPSPSYWQASQGPLETLI